MIDMSIYLAIILCFAFIVYGAVFINDEISKVKGEVKQMNTNLQTELDKLKECCNNKRLDNTYTEEDKNIFNNNRTIIFNLLRKIINDLYNLSDKHLVDYNDIEKTINLAKFAESIIIKYN